MERSRSGVGAGVWLFLPEPESEPELNFLFSAGAGAAFRNLVGVLITGIIVCSQSGKDFETRQKHLFRLEI